MKESFDEKNEVEDDDPTLNGSPAFDDEEAEDATEEGGGCLAGPALATRAVASSSQRFKFINPRKLRTCTSKIAPGCTNEEEEEEIDWSTAF